MKDSGLSPRWVPHNSKIQMDIVVQAQYKCLQEEDIYDDYEEQLISFMSYITRTWIGRGTERSPWPCFQSRAGQARGCHYG